MSKFGYVGWFTAIVALSGLTLRCSSSDDDDDGGTAQGGSGAGGASAQGGSAAGAASFAQVEMVIQSLGCANCHAGLLTVDSGLYDRMTGPIGMAPCTDGVLVDKSAPAMSLLPQVLAGTGSCDGSALPKMPFGCKDNACATAAQIKLIQDWIDAGAPEN
jgi:hypothetical protein